MFAYNLCYLLYFHYSWFIMGNRYFVWFIKKKKEHALIDLRPSVAPIVLIQRESEEEEAGLAFGKNTVD